LEQAKTVIRQIRSSSFYLIWLSAGDVDDGFKKENRRRSVMIERLPTDRIIETTAEKDHLEHNVEQANTNLAPEQPAPDTVSQFSAHERPSALEPISRRQLLSLVGTGGAAVAATALLAACSMGGDSGTAPSSSTSSGSGSSTSASSAPATQAPQGAATSASTNSNAAVLAKAADVPANSAMTFPIAGQQNPGVLVHLPSGSFVAYDSTCTHEQCEVKYNAQSHMLECPCHNAVFDPAKGAAVVSGPAPTPLAAIKVMVNSDGTITKA
jgi:Rieske Fe-S protein